MREKLLQFLILSLFTLINFLPYIVFHDQIPLNDWGYFNGMSYLLNLAISHYHTIPLYNPYTCGGMDILANPQSDVFSPFILLHFVFSPYWSNVWSIMICCVIGGFGMIKLLRYFNVEKNFALIGALIFISSSWFGLHFLEGHVAFRSLQLIGWAIYLIFNLEKHLKYWLYFSLLMAFFLLDGGIYTFNFCLLFFAIALFLKKPSLSILLKITRQNIGKILLILTAFLLITAPKIIPVLVTHNDLTPELGIYAYSLTDAFLSFFYPLNIISDQTIGENYRMHEFACYIGFLWIIPLILSAKKLQNIKPILAFSLICLWIGTGFGLILNPWFIFSLIPFLNNAHIQSRFLIFFFAFFAILTAKSLEKSKYPYLLAGLIILELSFARLYPLFHSFQNRENVTYHESIRKTQKHDIEKTVNYIAAPEVFITDKISSKLCYDKAQAKTNVLALEDKNYRGEFYSLENDLENKGKLLLKERSLDKISASYEGEIGDSIIFNTNYLEGFRGNNNDFEIKSHNGLLEVQFNKAKVDMIIKYRPIYLNFILPSFLMGILIYLSLLFTIGPKKTLRK